MKLTWWQQLRNRPTKTSARGRKAAARLSRHWSPLRLEALEDRTLLTPEGVPVRVTASFGVAEAQGESDPAELVAAADSALYEAKRRGKNRVARAAAPVQHP